MFQFLGAVFVLILDPLQSVDQNAGCCFLSGLSRLGFMLEVVIMIVCALNLIYYPRRCWFVLSELWLSEQHWWTTHFNNMCKHDWLQHQHHWGTVGIKRAGWVRRFWSRCLWDGCCCEETVKKQQWKQEELSQDITAERRGCNRVEVSSCSWTAASLVHVGSGTFVGSFCCIWLSDCNNRAVSIHARHLQTHVRPCWGGRSWPPNSSTHSVCH